MECRSIATKNYKISKTEDLTANQYSSILVAIKNFKEAKQQHE